MLPERVRSGAGISLAAACATVMVGCRATAPGAGPGAVRSETGAPADSGFQADLTPVTALAPTESYLWIGSARGLRRFHLPAGPVDWIGGGRGAAGGASADSPVLGQQVTALRADAAGHLLVATETGVSVLSELGQPRPRQARLAPLVGVTHLLSIGEGPRATIWAGNAQGLFVLAGGAAVAVPGAGGAAVTSLDADSDSKHVWAGLRGRGLLHVRVQDKAVTATFGTAAQPAVDLAESLGVAALPNGTQLAIGRNAAGATRILQLRMDGAELLVGQPELPVLAVVATTAGPLLLAGDAAAPRAYRLAAIARGQTVDSGVRFTPARKNLEGLRLAAIPDAREVPAHVTVAALSREVDQLFVGTRSAGVARLAPGQAGPADYLPVGELAVDARGLSVACLQRERCVLSTGAGAGWIWDGQDRTVKPIPDGAIGGNLMALAGDGAGTVYFVTSGAGKSLSIARLSGDGGEWQHLLDVPVAVDGVPMVGFATLSPRGDLWMTVRDRAPSGQEFGRGVIEVRLPAGQATHHRAYTAKEKAPPEAIAVAGDVVAVRFQPGQGSTPDATWFCTLSGVLRFAGGNLERWGENEGLESEHCNDLLVASDGNVWIATDSGAARYDGKQWLPASSKAAGAAAVRWPQSGRPGGKEADSENVAARALLVSGSAVWAATPKGLWPLQPGRHPLDRAAGLVDEDITDAVVDRFGRLWSLGHLGLTIRPAP